jgi:energy-coupling factor transporter ATP-binding protein EcfA2
MITRLTIDNFKRLEHVSFDLTERVVLIGPNNSGKSSILQALTLWEAAVRKWTGRQMPGPGTKITGVVLNRKDLLNLPVPSTRLLWFRQQVRAPTGKTRTTRKIRIQVIVEGVTTNAPIIDGADNAVPTLERAWRCGFEFDFANTESLTCRPLLDENNQTWLLDPAATAERVAYLQPMSGLAVREDYYVPGTINARIGEGKTADVLRNICFGLWRESEEANFPSHYSAEEINRTGFREFTSGWNYWNLVKDHMRTMFGVELGTPQLIEENGTIELTYKEQGNIYDLSSGGRGFLQTLLLLAYLYSAPRQVVLLDEPDAHLEVIRQREIFELLKSVTTALGSQLLIASHSEVVLNEAAGADTVVAVINNQTRTLNDPSQRKYLQKALAEIGWEKYYLATLRGHVLYLEGSTDSQLLLALARRLDHPVASLLPEANIQYVSLNRPAHAIGNFQALKANLPHLRGLALFDRLDTGISPDAPVTVLQWERREIENYFATPSVLLRYAQGMRPDLFSENRVRMMEKAIEQNVAPRYLADLNSTWWHTAKLSDDFLDPVLGYYAQQLKLSTRLFKTNFYELIPFVEPAELDQEVRIKLDILYDFLQPSPALTPNTIPTKGETE